MLIYIEKIYIYKQVRFNYLLDTNISGFFKEIVNYNL